MRNDDEGSGLDDEKDVEKANGVPGEEGPFAPHRRGEREERDGAEGDDDVTPSRRKGKFARKETSRREDEEIDSDEASEVRKDKDPEIQGIETAAEGNEKPVRGQQSAGKAKDHDGSRDARKDREQFDFTGEKREEKPSRDEQEQGPAADRTFPETF
jgi:hypothetical protein